MYERMDNPEDITIELIANINDTLVEIDHFDQNLGRFMLGVKMRSEDKNLDSNYSEILKNYISSR